MRVAVVLAAAFREEVLVHECRKGKVEWMRLLVLMTAFYHRMKPLLLRHPNRPDPAVHQNRISDPDTTIGHIEVPNSLGRRSNYL